MNTWTRIKADPARMASIFGLAGTGILSLAMLVTGLAYSGTTGERYSPLNHWVSELGEVGVSELAAVFNIGLIIGGACLAVFMVGVALTLEGRVSWFFGAVGLVSGASGLLVGVFPMNNLEAHASVALLFFASGLLAVLILSFYAFTASSATYPRWMALPGLPVIAAFVLFGREVMLMAPMSVQSFAAPEPGTRLDFWPVAATEWLVTAAVILWIIAVSLRLRSKRD